MSNRSRSPLSLMLTAILCACGSQDRAEAAPLAGASPPGAPAANAAARPLAAADTASGRWDASKPLILEGDVVTMTSTFGIVPGGRLVIQGEKITGLFKPGDPLPAGISASDVVTVKTSGWIFPGLIDAHNHVSYNVLPLYEVPKKYSNRYQWTSPKSYKLHVNTPKTLLTDSKFFNVEAEVVKYGEVKAIVGGVTSIQGSPDLMATRLLVRNIENQNFGQDKIQQRGLAITEKRWQDTVQAGLLQQMKDGNVDAWLVHLGEGIDASSRDEFNVLKSLNLLRDESVAIHATAFTATEFQEMSQAGTKIVWSPTSNLLLYGATTDVETAIGKGVVVCLGSDWSPSGMKNVLGELKMAHEIDTRKLGGNLSSEALVRMVTVNPAFALGLDTKIGSLRPGLYADIAVYRKRPSVDAYTSLVLSTERDVALVLIGGEPLYGEKALLEKLKPGDFEVLDAGGVEKALDLTKPTVSKGTETFGEIRDLLAQAMQFDEEDMWHTFGHSMSLQEFQTMLNEKFDDGIIPMKLDPVFAFGDTAFFSLLKNSTIANFGFDPADYWKADVVVESGGSDEKLLAFVNNGQTTLDVLDKDVGLDRRAAERVIQHRNGPDGNFGTGDDDPFDTVKELDDVPYVGPSTLNRLRAWASSH